MTTAPPSSACEQCQATGLPILPVRYAIVPKTVAPALPGWASGAKVKDIAAGNDFHYALRTMRAGYLYLYYDKNARGSKQWECYTVGEDGSLTRQPDPRSAAPQSTPVKQCARHGANNTQVHYLVIDKPDKCGPTWIAFSEYKWSEQTIKRYTDDSRIRNTRMQTIHPAEMARGAKHGHGAIADAASLEGVLEYAPAFNPADLPHGGEAPVVSRADGSHSSAQLAKMSTQHPWHLRTGRAAATVEHMTQRGRESKPHVLALWDAVGLAHELNGFRNDAAGRIGKYGEERALQLTAMANIDGAKAAMENRAAERADRAAESMQEIDRSGGMRQYEIMQRNQIITRHVPSLAGKQAFAALDTQNAQGTITEAQYQERRTALVNQHVPAADRAATQQAFADYDAGRAQTRRVRGENIQRARNNAISSAWARYEDNIDRPALTAFRTKHNAFLGAAAGLVDRRTQVLIAWLEAPLFLDALEDYHTEVETDGEEFAEVVADVIEGIGSCPSGERYLKTLVGRTDVTARGSLFWRAVAINQQKAREELAQALPQAEAQKEAPLTNNVAMVNTIVAQLKTFSGYYKKAVGIVAETDTNKLTPGSRALKNAGVDKLMMTAGDTVFKWLGLNRLGDFVGEKVIQNIFLARAGVSDVDAMALVRLQARVEGLDRQQTLERLRTARTFQAANDAISRQAGNRALREMWGSLRPVDKGRTGASGMRITVVTGLIELVNFGKLMSASDKTTKTYAQLVASAAALSAAIIDVSVIPYSLLGKRSRGFQKWKLYGGMLSGVASFIGAGIDFDASVDNYEQRRYAITGMYVVKGLLGLGATGGIALTTIATSAPLLKRVAQRAGYRIVIVAVEQVSSAVAKATVARVLGFLAGWEVALIIVAIQLLIWYFTPDALEEWCETCAFGKKSFGTPFTAPKPQEEAFTKALLETI